MAANDGSVAEIARRHDILAPQIYAWRRKFSRPAEPDAPPAAPVFLPVTVVPEVTHGQEAAGKNKASQRRSMNVEIRCKGGRVLKVDAGLAPSILQALVRAVEEA